MEYSNISSTLSFREKLSYIQNSNEYKGVLSKFGGICRLIFSCGNLDLRLTKEKCALTLDNNSESIFAKRIKVLPLNQSIRTVSPPVDRHAQENKAHHGALGQGDRSLRIAAECENEKLKKAYETLKKKTIIF